MSTSLITEAREAIEYIAGEWPRDVKRPDHLRKAARIIGLPYTAVVAIFYGKRKRLFADELLTLRERRAALQERRAKGETAHAVYAERFIRREHADAAGGTPPAAGCGGPGAEQRGGDRAGDGEAAAAGRSGIARDHER